MNNKELQRRMVRHGEILLLPVDSVPEGFEESFTGKEYIVGFSETHHHHIAIGTAPDAITVFKPIGADSRDIYLRVNSASRLEHLKTVEAHETKTLHEGVYLVRGKNEYDPFAKLIQRVRD
jgi:hypothetical protein